ncbi:hypothetical protein [Flavobacterium reichenbachii]|uniref:HTH cro/C1-type domain-containing protein n=1 Tax=Flavobacterium reichenbachii TaxID=362418 RepID=A0A085ZNV0_9FLAO|nr:hypothetical protein [Flavobacterium reichenbachii]KFF06114.1 hypothetical protein IW19_11500 [Flavobacterium reichenbachii]OXB14663.1 hypothetical protein B0A68_11450 [Flavobacterium reichenbachii]
MNSILDHIKQLAINEGVAITKLEQVIGASKGVLSRAIANKSDIQAKWIVKIIQNYPQYSCEWLIKGEGPMIKPLAANSELEGSAAVYEINYKDLAESRKETIESMKSQIRHLEEKIALNEKK